MDILSVAPEYYGTGRIARIDSWTNAIDRSTFFLYDHLGNTRVSFTASDLSPLELEIVYAGDYFPYGKVLREFVDGDGGDRYLTTMHERDKETGLDYRGARYYDSDVARFLSLDPLAAKYPTMSAYNYVAGNPIILIDPNGKEIIYKGEDISSQDEETGWTENHLYLNDVFGDANGFNEKIAANIPEWASGYGHNVHQIANMWACYHIFGWDTDENRKKAFYIGGILDQATVYSDSKKFQTGPTAYRHAMRNKGQTVAEAKAMADKFVRTTYQWAINYYNMGEMKLAFYNLGVALHTLQDGTSPAHIGFQEWSGDESVGEIIEHAKKEMAYPGADSNLQLVTEWFINSFLNQQALPSGNLFDLNYFK